MYVIKYENKQKECHPATKPLKKICNECTFAAKDNNVQSVRSGFCNLKFSPFSLSLVKTV
jgi:hypothetical protein